MKKSTYFLGLIVLALLVTFSNCKKKGEDEKTAEELRLELMARTWNVTNATLDGTNVTTDYSGMTLTFTTSKGYSVSGGDFTPVWPASGTFDFASASNVNQFTRQPDNVDVTIVSITETNMTLSFTFATTGRKAGRTTGVDGDYVFDFSAN